MSSVLEVGLEAAGASLCFVVVACVWAVHEGVKEILKAEDEGKILWREKDLLEVERKNLDLEKKFFINESYDIAFEKGCHKLREMQPGKKLIDRETKNIRRAIENIEREKIFNTADRDEIIASKREILESNKKKFNSLQRTKKAMIRAAPWVAYNLLILGGVLVVLMVYAIIDLEHDRDDHSEPETKDFDAMENRILNSKSSPTESILFSNMIGMKPELSGASACTL